MEIDLDTRERRSIQIMVENFIEAIEPSIEEYGRDNLEIKFVQAYDDAVNFIKSGTFDE
jgi:hypothetical protein